MATVGEMIQTLVDMGFDEHRSKRALDQTGWSGIESAMEWLLANPDDPEQGDTNEPGDKVEAEDTTPRAELSVEERAEKLRRLEELRIQKRLEREEKEKKEAIEREKKRIHEGKLMTDIRQQLADKEMKRLAEERRREKLETQRARERVKLQIQADRMAKKMETSVSEKTAAAAPSPRPSESTEKLHEETKLQIRLKNGTALVQNFGSKEPLSAVRLFVQIQSQDDDQIKLMTNFPKKVFDEADYQKPLYLLGLTPSAVLIVMK